jgi:large conductance mechanosensitive channel
MSKIKNFFGEFKKFITRGNVLDMAVGVIVGGAFTAIVNGMSNFILKPIINWVLALIIGKEGLSGAITMLSPAYKDILNDAGEVIGNELDLAASIYIDWGSFISAIINFLLIAFVLFLIVRTINRISEAQAEGLSESKAIAQIRRERKVSKKEAMAILQAQRDEAAAAKVEADRLAAEQAAADAAAAEAKAMANTRLLEEIRDLLKNK